MSYVRLFLRKHTINTFDFCYFINDQNGEQIQKSRNFFCFIEYKYAAHLLNQHRQLTNSINDCGALFC